MSYLITLQSFEDTELRVVGPMVDDNQKNFVLNNYEDLSRLSGLAATPLCFVADYRTHSEDDVLVHSVPALIQMGLDNCQTLLNSADDGSGSEESTIFACAASEGLKVLRQLRESASQYGFA